MNAEQIRANNERLQKAFQTLDADPSATKAQWDELGMQYYVAGYLLNASACFKRADAVEHAVQIAVEVA